MKCLLCGSQDYQDFAQVESFGYPLTYYQCDQCGLIFQSPQAAQATDPQFYAETYRRIYQSSAEPTVKDLWVQEHRALSLVSIYRTLMITAPERMLDIGASTGGLLEAFREAFGVDVIGVEPGDAYRTYAEERGLSMFPSIDALKASQPPRFDLISMIHVLEHLADPISMLNGLRTDLLSDNGILLLEVPNFYAHDSYELAHLACYTPHTLQMVLRQAGYHVFFFHRHGFPRSSMLNLYLTLMAQPLPQEAPPANIKREGMVRQKRQVGMLYRRGIQKLFPHQAWLPLPGVEE
jgi:2-polyprenyl-3-methyl-5-hydroxy-6-metoxy-1,4-benzoquinol methylase